MGCGKKLKQRTTGLHSIYGLFRCFRSGHQRSPYPQLPRCASKKARQFYGFVSNFDTGPPEIAVSVAASNRF